MTDSPTRSEPRTPGERVIDWMRRRAENGADLVYALGQLEQAEAEAAAPDAGLRAAQEVVDQLDDYGTGGPGFAEAIRHARAALAAHPAPAPLGPAIRCPHGNTGVHVPGGIYCDCDAPAGPAVDAPDLDAMESLRMLFDMLERLDGQADIGPMVQVTSAMWRDIVRPAIQQVRTALPRSLPSEPPRDPKPVIAEPLSRGDHLRDRPSRRSRCDCGRGWDEPCGHRRASR